MLDLATIPVEDRRTCSRLRKKERLEFDEKVILDRLLQILHKQAIRIHEEEIQQYVCYRMLSVQLHADKPKEPRKTLRLQTVLEWAKDYARMKKWQERKVREGEAAAESRKHFDCAQEDYYAGRVRRSFS